MINIERQIKRKIYSREHDFFVITPLHFENITSKELNLLGLKHNITSYGIEVKAKLEDLYKMNLCLRTASRILFRISKFKALNVKELKENISKIDWYLFFKEHSLFSLKISSKTSKLYHSGLIEDCVKNEILKYSIDNNLNLKYSKKENSIKIYIRTENNKFIVSIDSSGENLYKRGYKKISSFAPLRENIAAALLLKYWDKNLPLLDPMTGSGTFSLEAFMIRNNIASGKIREFSFMDWANFKEKTFNFMKNNLIESEFNLNCSDIISCDKDEKLINKVAKNFSIFKNFQKPYYKDFFDLEKPYDIGLVVMNLPYGKRIKTEKYFYKKIEEKLKRDFKNWQVLLVYPSCKKINLDGDIFKIKNGGLDVNILYGKL